jgi:inositol-hexakisphosphate kinase
VHHRYFILLVLFRLQSTICESIPYIAYACDRCPTLMSTSPPDPENAAPAAPVRPEQAHEPAQTADQNNARRAAAQRNLSFSLLSRLFSPFYQVGEPSTVAAGSDKFAETTANTDSSCQAGMEGNNLNDINNRDYYKHSMATNIPPAKPLALSAGGTPTPGSKEFDLADIREVNSLLMGHRDLLNNKRGRGTSLERTRKEKRVQEFSKSAFSINPGDTGMINSPAPQSPTAPITSSDNSFLDGVRASYRSWRDAHPGVAAEKAWSFGEQASGEVPEGQVEKSVAEALAGIEPNSRSRKASHSLRFFREGLPEEKPKRREPKDSGRVKDKLPRMKDLAPSDIGNVGDDNGTKSLDKTTHDSASSGIETPLSTSDGTGQKGECDSFPGSSQPQVEKRPNALPAQLLDDLRKKHNLTPAPTKGFPFSYSLPVSESERSKSSGEPQGVPNNDIAQAATSEKKSITRDEDEESGEEQISSALFVPHKTSHDSPEHEVLGRGDRDQSGSLSQQSDRADSEEWLVEHKIPHRRGDDVVVGKASPHDLLEAIRDQTPEQERDNYPADALHSPDLHYDAVSEPGYSTKDEESSFTDDTETTPTGRNNGKRYLSKNHKDHLHHHQQIAKAPLEAIELIPYRHQVGGHTTMWRFSKRAVCKQLNNRENEFYERIERYHPKLLKFMPRYVGFT